MHEPTVSLGDYEPDLLFATDTIQVLKLGCTCGCWEYVTDTPELTVSEVIATHGVKHADRVADCPHSRAHGESGLWVCNVCGERFVRPEVRDLYGYPGNAREAADLTEEDRHG